jgi:hypothetical protein
MSQMSKYPASMNYLSGSNGGAVYRKLCLAILVVPTFFVTSSLTPATAEQSSSDTLVTCINLTNARESISKDGDCTSGRAIAKWKLVASDTPVPEGSFTKQLVICSNRADSSYSYQVIRSTCSAHQERSIYTRKAGAPGAPTIVSVVAYSDQNASILLSQGTKENLDAPIAYFTINISNGESRKVKSSKDLRLAIGGLRELTTYSFTVTATNADGTSEYSKPSEAVTTKKYIPPVVVLPVSAPAVLSCAAGGACAIGDVGPGGGIIFYVASAPFTCGSTLNATCNYLEVAPTTGSAAWTDPQLKWSSDDSQFRNSGSTGTAIGTGRSNTVGMLTSNAPYSADVAEAAFATSQYAGPSATSDWHLPSKDELNQLCKWQRGQAWVSDATICNSSGSLNSATLGAANAGFVSANYWSSTEYQRFPWECTAWNQQFGSGNQVNTSGKNFQLYVRPIRAF